VNEKCDRTEDRQVTAEQILERWALPPELDEAGKSAMRTKAAAVPVEHHAFGTMSDEWVANRVRMLMRQDIWHEAICCASRDRIMRLSLEVERLREVFEEACREVRVSHDTPCYCKYCYEPKVTP